MGGFALVDICGNLWNCYRLSEIPTYRDILGGKYIEYDWGEYPQRMTFEELKRRVVA